jgi:hypothetical protein
MDIKSLISVGSVIAIDPKSRVEGGVRTRSSTDRDADGKRESPQQEQKNKLTATEFEEALKILKGMAGLKANDLVIRIEMQDTVRIILIEDLKGNVVRRLTEAQLWLATRDKDRHTGAILDKAV